MSFNIPILLPVNATRENRISYGKDFFYKFIKPHFNYQDIEINEVENGRSFRHERMIYMGQYIKFGVASTSSRRISSDEFKKWFVGENKAYSDKIIQDVDGSSEFYYMTLLMSGSACREFEIRCNYSWNEFNDYLVNCLQGWATRFDLAGDYINYDKIANFYTILRYLKDGCYTSTYRKLGKIYDDEDGQGVYLGSGRGSNNTLIYNKYLERLANDVDVVDSVRSWMRIEMRFLDNAKEVYELVTQLGYEKINEIYASLLYHQLDFKNPKGFKSRVRGKHLDELETVQWWKKFIGDVKKCSVKNQHKLESTISSTEKWLKKSTSTARAKQLLTKSNINVGFYHDIEVAIEGISNLLENPKELSKVNNERILKGMFPLSSEDLADKIYQLRLINNIVNQHRDEILDVDDDPF